MFCLQVGVAHAKYKNCGHKTSLTPEQATQVVDFVKHWRAKVFCICRHVRAESRLKVSLTTISRTLNRHISFSVGVAHTQCKNCGRKKSLTPEHAEQVVDFVKQWRAKVFCICLHIRAELKMKVSLAIFLEPSTGTCHLSVEFLSYSLLSTKRCQSNRLVERQQPKSAGEQHCLLTEQSQQI